MVLLAAAICTKPGKALVSRQFVEMTRARIEGLLAAFPKLISSDKVQRQHTFVETDSVRYVYQPLDQLYVLLITTKASNILDDLETLRLFSRVIPEYCRSNDEKEILEQAFPLIFAFDEIVALGYRENVNLAQIRTFTEMDSHEERVFWQIKKTQEEEAKKLAKDKAKELQRIRVDTQKRGGRQPAHMTGIGGSASSKYEPTAASTDVSDAVPKSMYKSMQPSRPAGSGKALKLGAKKADEDLFVKQLKSEGQDVAATTTIAPTSLGSIGQVAAAAAPHVKHETVHIRADEKMNVVITRDGRVESFDLSGILQLHVTDPKLNTVKMQVVANQDQTHGSIKPQLQTHPNLDKKLWESQQLLQLKSAQKPFPINTDIGVLKWRLTTTDESSLPLTINCWPNESVDGVQVNIEYTLEMDDMTLNHVTMVIPLPAATAPVVAECDGEYKYEKSKSQLLWMLPIIDRSNKTGSFEFSTPNGHADHFFPVRISFSSESLYCDIKPLSVSRMDESGGSAALLPFSNEAALIAEKYEII